MAHCLWYLKILKYFAEGKKLLGGAFSLPLDPMLDTSSSKLAQLQLLDLLYGGFYILWIGTTHII